MIEHDALGRKNQERSAHQYHSKDWQVILEQDIAGGVGAPGTVTYYFESQRTVVP